MDKDENRFRPIQENREGVVKILYGVPDAFNELEQEFLKFSVEYKYILLNGDFNSRTSRHVEYIETVHSQHDIVETDNVDVLNNLELYDMSKVRCSMDTSKNSYGNIMLEMCKNNNIVILNGRVNGDKEGKFTCRQASVVDYFICTYDFLCFVVNMYVQDFSKLFSDVHSPLILSLNFKDCIEEDVHIAENSVENAREVKRVQKWDVEKKNEFVEFIDKDKISDLVAELESVDSNLLSQGKINEVVENINSIFLDAAENQSETCDNWYECSPSKTTEPRRNKYVVDVHSPKIRKTAIDKEHEKPSTSSEQATSLYKDQSRHDDGLYSDEDRQTKKQLDYRSCSSNIQAYIPITDLKTSRTTSSVGSLRSLPTTSPSRSRTTSTPSKLMSPARSFSPELHTHRTDSSSRSTQTSKARRSMDSSSSEAVCRICHEGGSTEQLFSPCYCSGSIGLLHVSCLQRWLGSSNKTCCELCHFQFKVERSPKPFCLMCLRHNYGLWKDWKQINQNVRIICEPSSELQKQTIRNSPSGKVNMQRVKLCSVKIKVSTNMNSPKRQATPEIYHHLRLTESNIKRSLEDPTSYRKNLVRRRKRTYYRS
ncbi:MARCH2 [Mytilus edulis]|uniref:MARCH2 n=1 Tax=Mytilus edulis TaxID=6550 RepID=A0A8S3UTS7_MYTED|nr:MARCH2 [Mytilus edulis]